MTSKQAIVVIGGTGQQGAGVVRALLERGEFAVRVATRNPGSDAARALVAKGVEAVKADLLDPTGLGKALKIPPETFDGLYPGAREVREMFQYFEACTYFGPPPQKKGNNRHDPNLRDCRQCS